METIKVKYGNRHEWINNDMKGDIKERGRILVNSKKYPTEDNMCSILTKGSTCRNIAKP